MSDGPPPSGPNPPHPPHPPHPPQYPYPYGYYPPPPPTNGLGIASLVLGIVWIYGLGAVLAVIFGHIALKQINERGERGRGLAIAGLVLGYVGIAGAILFVFVFMSWWDAIESGEPPFAPYDGEGFGEY